MSFVLPSLASEFLLLTPISSGVANEDVRRASVCSFFIVSQERR